MSYSQKKVALYLLAALGLSILVAYVLIARPKLIDSAKLPCADLQIPRAVQALNQSDFEKLLETKFSVKFTDLNTDNSRYDSESPALSKSELTERAKQNGYASRFISDDLRKAARYLFLEYNREKMNQAKASLPPIFQDVIGFDCSIGDGVKRNGEPINSIANVRYIYVFHDGYWYLIGEFPEPDVS